MTELPPGDLVEEAVELARQWLTEARAGETRREAAVGDRLHDLVDEPAGVEFAMQYVDRVARHRDNRLAAAQLASLVERSDLPTFLGAFDRTMLRLGARLGPLLPGVVMPLARRRLRQLVGHLLVDADKAHLHRHMAKKKSEAVALNINLLGEAVLGEAEATSRFDRTLDLIADPAVTYVSVKASAIASQIDLWSFDDSLARINDRLRDLYAAAAATSPPTFVNLDMEEYTDLDLTIQAFMTVLDEREFGGLDGGIVLQAYLPESFDALQRVTSWATSRRRRAGGEVKVRLVKGANLAMERVDAAMHGWTQAPFATKAEVDANYKQCLDWALTSANTHAVRIGVASHNLFDVAWAKQLVDHRGLADRVDFEMLQGMAPAQARVVRTDADGLLLYTPIVAPEDFDVAISYLIRRLEENASGDNFLRHLFSLEPDSPEFEAQADVFRTAVASRRHVDNSPRRRGRNPTLGGGFDNHPDTDPALPATQKWLCSAREIAPSDCRTSVTSDPREVADHLKHGRGAHKRWWHLGAEQRRRILWQTADEIDRRRDELLATMASEARKTFAQADPEVSEAIDFARWYGDRAAELEAVDNARFEPLGVVAVVPPWNFPVAIPAGGTFAALAAGNAAILKPAPETPRCAEIIVEAAHAAGVPTDVLQFVRTPDDEAGKTLVVGADGVILTGGTDTARLFRSWRPDLPLFAETSGKNALVITPHADIDHAVDDLVKSAFGHSGQKCSAASLAILVGGVADDERFRRQLVDAVESLRLGWPTDPAPNYGPIISTATGKLARALTELDTGESWLVEPRQRDDGGAIWSPGVREGVTENSWFHQTECFGPVLGLMRARDLDHAIRIQNRSAFGLTGGIHSLDDEEIEQWLESVEVGNAYVNRQITGAIVRRQPFGGWKGSSVGLGAKAGGSDYLLQLGRWSDSGPGESWSDAAARSDETWWSTYYSVTHDPTGLFCEANDLRYVAHPDVVIRATADADAAAVERAVSAARQVCPDAVVSTSQVEDDHAFERRLPQMRWGRVRLVGSAPRSLRAAAADNEVHLIEEPVTASGRLELRLYLREQSVSRTLHRFGNVPVDSRLRDTLVCP